MRTALAALLGLAGVLVAQAGEDLTVLKDTNGVPPRKLLYEYLRGECQKHFDARRAEVAKLKTPEDVKARQKMLRGKFLEAIGAFPDRTPLNPRVVGHLKGDGFRVEKIIYESRPEHHVTAVMYLPDPLPPRPNPSGLSPGGAADRSPRWSAAEPWEATVNSPESPVGATEPGETSGAPTGLNEVARRFSPDSAALHPGLRSAAPTGAKTKIPGVLVPCGHSANGKAAEAYQRACILMAKSGLAVLCYDPIGQGERIQLLQRAAWFSHAVPAIAGSTSEHTMCGIGALLVGRSTAHYRIWDGIRSLDYLASRPEVDPERLGCAGNSGGGTLTAYLMALDDRILAAAPSCYITSLERLFATIGPQDAEQNIPGQVAFGMEHADYLTMRAPKPTLILTSTRDFFDIQGAWTTFREAKRIYGLMGHGERVDFFEYDDQHGWSKPRREAAARFMVRWLLGKDVPLTEPDFPIFKDAELQCTRTGQVLEDFKGKSVFDLNAEREAELVSVREKWLEGCPKEDRLQRVFELTRVPARRKRLNEEVFGKWTSRGDYLFCKGYCGDPRIPIPYLYFYKPSKLGKLPDRFTDYLSDAGIAVVGQRGAAMETLANDGAMVVAHDLPGMGETSPQQVPANRPNYFGADSRESFLGLHLARPLLGQRVEHYLNIFDFYAHNLKPGDGLHAVGSMGPIALHAAALDPRIKSLTLENSLLSWSAVVRSPISVNQLTNVVPGVLQYYDLPDLAALLAPRPLTIRNPVDAQGRPVSQAELEKVYAKAIEAYKRAGASDKLVLEGKK